METSHAEPVALYPRGGPRIPEEPAFLENSSAYQFLRSLTEFRELPTAELLALATGSRLCALSAGQCLMREGDEEVAFGFIIVSGCISMLKTSVSGKELIVELLQARDTFGLLVMLAEDVESCQLTARAICDSRVLLVPTKSFWDALRAQPSILKDLLSHLLLCLQSSYRLSRGLAHDRVEVRIAGILSSLALKSDRFLQASRPPSITLTRQQLADLAGTTTETAIRVTRAMQREGLIDIARPGLIRILNLPALQHLVEG